MKKLTDEMVAKTLGWKYHLFPGPKSKCLVPGYWVDEGLHERGTQAPAFTTSLDAIVREIEARELYFEVMGSVKYNSERFQATVENVAGEDGMENGYYAKTPALALCAALLAYLKEKP